jgi:hypothetical protein
MLLADIGESGQARLQGAVAALAGDGLSHEIASLYALRAGLGEVIPGPIDEAKLAPAFLENPAARAVVAGSRAALLALRAALAASAAADP